MNIDIDDCCVEKMSKKDLKKFYSDAESYNINNVEYRVVKN